MRSNYITINDLLPRQVKLLIKEEKLASLDLSDHKYKAKHEHIHGFLSEEEWENIFLLPHKIPVTNKLKELQYKIIMRFVPTNYLLYKMGKVTSQTCTFCHLEPETIEHLFFDCIHVKNIWYFIINEWQRVSGNIFLPTLKDCILGLYNQSVSFFY